MSDPEVVLEEILADWPKGVAREPIVPSEIRSKRKRLDAADEQAIRAICSQSATELLLN